MRIKNALKQLPRRVVVLIVAVIVLVVLIAISTIILLIIVLHNGNTPTTTAQTKTAANTNAATALDNVNDYPITIDLAGITHIRGTGDYTIVEFGDTECPYCKQFQDTMKTTIEAYAGKVQWGFKHFPLNIHPKAEKEAQALECASDQGKFWEYTDEIYRVTTSNNTLDDSQIYTIADTVGLNRTQFDTCVASGEKKAIVDSDKKEAEDLGGRGTPFVLIVDKSGKIVANVPGAVPWDDTSKTTDMKRILARVLK